MAREADRDQRGDRRRSEPRELLLEERGVERGEDEGERDGRGASLRRRLE